MQRASLEQLVSLYGRQFGVPASLSTSDTGFGWQYFQFGHVASTTWTRFALDGFNPYGADMYQG